MEEGRAIIHTRDDELLSVRLGHMLDKTCYGYIVT